jgi:hypothetical protein
MEGDLGTTNMVLGVMAAAMVVQTLLVISMGVACWRIYRRAVDLLNGFEQRQLAPVMTRLNAILDDVKRVTATVRDETERVDDAIRLTMHRVDETAHRVRSNVRANANRVMSFVHGLRIAIGELLQARKQPPARAAGRV